MTDLQKAIEWLQYVKQLKEANLRSYPHRTQDAEAVEHCKVLLDALRENKRLKAKLDAVRAECDKAMLVKNPLKHTECLTVIGDKLNVILAIIGKDGDDT